MSEDVYSYVISLFILHDFVIFVIFEILSLCNFFKNNKEGS